MICCGKVGGSISGWAVVCFGVSGSVSDVVGTGIGMVWVIGVVAFGTAVGPAMVGDGVGCEGSRWSTGVFRLWRRFTGDYLWLLKSVDGST